MSLTAAVKLSPVSVVKVTGLPMRNTLPSRSDSAKRARKPCCPTKRNSAFPTETYSPSLTKRLSMVPAWAALTLARA